MGHAQPGRGDRGRVRGTPCDSMSLDKREKIGYYARWIVQKPGFRSRKTEEWLQGGDGEW
jgi:hypothetical protein